MPQTLLLLVIAGFVSVGVLASCGLWCAILVKWGRGEPILPWNPQRRLRREWGLVAVAVSLFFILPVVAYQFVATEKPDEPQAQRDPAVASADGAVANRDEEEETPDAETGPVFTPEEVREKVIATCLGHVVFLGLAPFLMRVLGLEWDAEVTPGAADFGITQLNFGRQVADGVLGFIACIAPVLLVRLSTLWMQEPGGQHPFLKLLMENPEPLTIALIALAAVVLAPLVEEMIFRVMLQGWLQTVISPRWAIVSVAVLFCFVHGFPDSLALMPLALILGAMYYRRYSYISVVVVHMLFNGVNLLLALIATTIELPDSPPKLF